MEGYLHPQVHKSDSEAHKAVMRSRRPAIVAEGTARSSKTITNLQKLLACHARYEGFKSCIVRTDAVDLQDTIRGDFTDLLLRYEFSDPRSQIRASGGKRFDHLYLNGGVCILGGMNRRGRVLGTQYDLIMMSELSQFEEADYQILRTRCSGSAGNWREDDEVYYQILCDTNPDVPSHWMYKYEAEGDLEFVKFGFKDNPHFYRKRRWSIEGKTYVNGLDQSLTGIWRDRYFLGLRVAPEGQVYRIRPANIIHKFPDLSGCNLYRAMDWGMRHPSICLWIAEHKETFDTFVYREWRKTHTDILAMGNEVKAYSEGEAIESTIIDHDENRQILLRDQHDIYSEFAYKGAGSVLDRVFLINTALRRAQEGKDGGLYIYDGLVCNSDPNPDIQDDPGSLIEEMEKLQFSETKDMPIKEFDDACDALGYYYLWRSRQREIDLPAILGKVKLYDRPNSTIV